MTEHITIIKLILKKKKPFKNNERPKIIMIYLFELIHLSPNISVYRNITVINFM